MNDIIIKTLVVTLLVSTAFTGGRYYQKDQYNTLLQEQHDQFTVQADKKQIEFINKQSIMESNQHELQLQVAKSNDALSRCSISIDLLRQFKRATMSSTSDISNTHERERGDDTSDTGLNNFTCEDLSENYISVVHKYKNCAVQYNSLLSILGY